MKAVNFTDEIVRCDYCRRTVRRGDSLVVVDRKDGWRRKRLCRDCQLGFYLDEVRKIGLKGEGGAKLRLFNKAIKDGK